MEMSALRLITQMTHFFRTHSWEDISLNSKFGRADQLHFHIKQWNKSKAESWWQLAWFTHLYASVLYLITLNQSKKHIYAVFLGGVKFNLVFCWKSWVFKWRIIDLEVNCNSDAKTPDAQAVRLKSVFHLNSTLVWSSWRQLLSMLLSSIWEWPGVLSEDAFINSEWI